MRANRRTDTKPELALRSALHRRGYRFRKDFRLDLDSARVRPDIAFTARRVAVFVDGCFWHVCPEHGRDPRVNEWYWAPKLRRNMERDRAADAALDAAGWRVIRVWEHEPLEAAVAAVIAALDGRSRPGRGNWRAVAPRRWHTASSGQRGRTARRSWHPGPGRRLTTGNSGGSFMRVYLSATLPMLAGLLRDGEIGPPPLRAFAVTPALRESYASGDVEELEYVAMTHAARGSLRMLMDDPQAPRRRVVLAAEVPDDAVDHKGGFDEPTLVLISAVVPLRRVASGHVDDLVAVADVAAAADALRAAEAGDDDARFVVDGAEGHELLWYATQELPYLFD